MKNKNIILFGYSGHAYSVINGILSNEDIVIGYYDAKENQNNPYNITYLGHENDISQLKKIQQNCRYSIQPNLDEGKAGMQQYLKNITLCQPVRCFDQSTFCIKHIIELVKIDFF